MRSKLLATVVGASLMLAGAAAHAGDTPEYPITIKDHKFEPAEIKIPAGQKVKLRVHNADPTPEEFESNDFKREKIIDGGATASIFVGPLEPGTYSFFGEFNMDTAQGKLIVE